MTKGLLERLKTMSDKQEAEYWEALRKICKSDKEPTDQQLASLLDLGKVFGFTEPAIKDHMQAYDEAQFYIASAEQLATQAMNRPNEIAEAVKDLPIAKTKVETLRKELQQAESDLKDIAHKARGGVSDYAADYRDTISKVYTIKHKFPKLLDWEPKTYTFPTAVVAPAPRVFMP